MRRLILASRTRFVAGLLVTVPAIVTFLALRFLFRQVDSVLGPWMGEILGRQIPGLGVVATGLVVLLVGVVASHYTGRKLIGGTERLFGAIPLVRRIYNASKEIVETATLSRKQLFRDVVMIEYPRQGLYSYGFVTGYTVRHDGDHREELANVFLPNPPVPTTGGLVAISTRELFVLDMSVEEALKLILSGGIVIPTDLQRRKDSNRQVPKAGTGQDSAVRPSSDK